MDASPRPHSVSRRIADEFVSALRKHASFEHKRRDVARDPVPHITSAWTEICDNLMRDQITELEQLHRGARTSAQQEAWSVLAPLLGEVVQADLIVVATPMYNYSVPSSLKAWLDQITFPRMVLAPRRFVIVAARGGSYEPGSPKAAVEHQVRYLSDFVQGHFAVDEPAVIAVDFGNATVDPLLSEFGPTHEASVANALSRATQLASSFAGSSVDI